jgi:enoyl-CoA hydratase/carnithine racemase
MSKTIVLSGAGKNALSTALMERALTDLRAAKDCPILLRGDGDAFSAGLNLREVATLDAAGMTTFLGTMDELVKALYEHPAPVVAWVNGHAIAGGCVLALCADFRFMTARDGARIGLTEVALGLQFPPLALAVMRARVSAPAIERVVLEAALYTAEDGRRLGLVDAIGEEDDARTMLGALSSHPGEAYATMKRRLRPRLVISEEEHRRFQEDAIPQWTSPERRAQLLAWLETRRSARPS